jgi:hypothetical protein
MQRKGVIDLRASQQWKMPTVMKKPPKPPANAEKSSAKSQNDMLLTVEQHAKLARAYTNPPPDLSPEGVKLWKRLARHHAGLARAARKREAQKENPNS